MRRLAPLALVALAGCSVLVQPNLDRLRDGAGPVGDGAGGPDVVAPPADAAPPSDGGGPVEDVVTPPADGPSCPNNCDDRVACTTDRCNSGMCVNTPDNTACGADMRCDPVRGCVPVTTMRCRQPSDCSDGNPCTVEACNSGVCANTPVDMDMDGFPAAQVAGRACGFANADCDDGNRAINPRATEVCDRVDNNCNGVTDEAPACMMMMGPPNATCATAARLDLTSSTSAEVNGDNSRVTSAVQGYCGRSDGASGGELWYQVVWPAGRDLVLEAIRGSDGMDPVLFVANGCGQPPIVCNDDIGARERNARVYIRSESITGIGTRTVFVAVDAFNATSVGPFRLRARTQMPSNNDCGGGFAIEGGAVRSVPSAGSLRQSLCAMGVGNVEYYRYRGSAGQVRLSTTAGTIAVRRDCIGMPFCQGMSSMFTSDGDSIIAVDRPGAAYTFTLYTP